MNISTYADKNKELQISLLNFIESDETSVDISNNEFLKYYENQKNSDNCIDVRTTIHLIAQVSKNHHRNPGFISKIEQILLYFENDMKLTFTNLELFDIFKRNRRILLFLIEKKIILINESITNLILKGKEKKVNKKILMYQMNSKQEKDEQNTSQTNLSYFLYPEIKPFLDEESSEKIKNNLLQIDQDIFTNFNEKRLIGENDYFICKLIREDSIDEFIPYVHRNNTKLSGLIPQSIFETNPLLIKTNPTLIEYAAFYGSFQIFQFLEKNSVKLNPMLWVYSIHGQNPDLFHLIESSQVTPDEKNNDSYLKCCKESIKCHHIDFTNYIIDNLASKNDLANDYLNEYNENIIAYCFRYYNFSHLPVNDLIDKFAFFYSCQFDHTILVNSFLKNKNYNPKDLVILTIKNFFNEISIQFYMNVVLKQ